LPLAESVVDTFSRTGSRAIRASGLRLLVRVHHALGNHEAARRAMCDAIEVHRWLGPGRGLPSLLETVAATCPDADVAPTLLGCAAALRTRWQVPVFAPHREEYGRCYAQVRAAHAAGDFERAFAAGRLVEREKAIDSALALLSKGDATDGVEAGAPTARR
ncbi:MAG TPA: hypothetical protein VFJ68_08215, partial [Casimicrobiaceae bacterium]|nr:hypothetical protein [Casimicrobiaceae bacterium]